MRTSLPCPCGDPGDWDGCQYAPKIVRVEMDGFPEDDYFVEIHDYLDESYRVPGGVYFVQGVDGGPIKIGWSKFPPDAQRLKTLQTGSPVELRLLGFVRGSTTRLERDLHDEFSAYRLHGEWFEPSNDLLDVIDRWSWSEE